MSEIMGSLFLSATIVMLHPYGHMDFMYFTFTLQKKQITYMLAVASFLNHLCDFIEYTNNNSLSTMRSLSSTGQ